MCSSDLIFEFDLTVLYTDGPASTVCPATTGFDSLLTPGTTGAAVTPAEPTGGTGGATLTNLKNIALNNGINLDDAKYAEQLSKWVADIKAGADPEKYYGFIRAEAAKDKNAWVKKQLAAGKDLRDIYAGAITQVATQLGLDAASVDLNDPIFGKLFTDKGMVDTKTLANIIHADSRWAGTTADDKRQSEIQINIQAIQNAAKANGVDIATLFPDGLDAIATSIEIGRAHV